MRINVTLLLLAIFMGMLFQSASIAQPKFSVGGDLSYGSDSGWYAGLNLGYALNNRTRLKIISVSGQEESLYSLGLVYKYSPEFYLGAAVNYTYEKRDIYLGNPSTSNELEFRTILGLEIPNQAFTPFIEHNLVSNGFNHRFGFGVRYYFWDE
jgi:opacity protein-like surface antigen